MNKFRFSNRYHPHLYRIGGDGARFRDISDAELCDQFELNA